MNTVKRDSFPYDEVEKRIGYSFKNRDLLVQAFTRSSYGSAEDNEVLEFIGDSVIGMVVTKILANRYKRRSMPEEQRKAIAKWLKRDYTVPEYFLCVLDESELSKLKIELVQRSSLAAATERLGLEQYLIMGKSDVIGEVQNQKSVKEDLFEAIIGVIAIDSDWDMPLLENIVDRLINIDHRLENGVPGGPDYVEMLERWFAEKGENLECSMGQPQCVDLPYECDFGLNLGLLCDVVSGYGKTEKEAQRMAAKQAVEFIRVTTDRISAISAAVGEPSVDMAVSQLQELYQKKMIPEPEYEFREDEKSDDGNPTWSCLCIIDGLGHPGYGNTCETKKEAKKLAAYTALVQLCETGIENIAAQHKD